MEGKSRLAREQKEKMTKNASCYQDLKIQNGNRKIYAWTLQKALKFFFDDLNACLKTEVILKTFKKRPTEDSDFWK